MARSSPWVAGVSPSVLIVEDELSIRDILTGLFERVEKKTAESHRNAGDVIAWGYPNVAVVPEERSPAILDPAPPRGQHGGLNTHRELHPPLFAIGQGVPLGAFGEIAQTKIARFVAGLLGIAPPAAAE